MKKIEKGFTLVELLVVIAIVAILAAVVVLVINPLELTRRGRDATRLSDLSTLQQAINVTLQERSGQTNVLCPVATPAHDASNPCRGKSTDANARKSDGTGWVKMNLAGQPVTVPILPADPVNDADSTKNLYYEYASDGTYYELNANLESTQYNPKELNATGDGGSDDTKYEVGSKLDII